MTLRMAYMGNVILYSSLRWSRQRPSNFIGEGTEGPYRDPARDWVLTAGAGT
jgi:hypothetical protein